MHTTLLALLAAAAIAPAAVAQTSFFNTSPITIPASGQAAPFPSTIEVWGLKSGIARVSVTILGLNHPNPDDLDILLIAPSGSPRAVVLMSDCGGTTDLTNRNITLTDFASVDLPDSSTFANGTFRPTDFQAGETWPVPPSPTAGPFGRSLSVLTGANPNGVWQLVVIDDAASNAGSISGGWSLTIDEQPEPSIVGLDGVQNQIPAGGANPGIGVAARYPQTLLVQGAAGPVESITMSVLFNHSAPDDVDMLLVGPRGQTCFLMGDCGGTTPTFGVTITFDDNAAFALPNSTAITTGTYRPINYAGNDGVETFPAPAPVGPYGTSLGVFDGTNPNGTWSLYLLDDQAAAAGNIETWTLTINQRRFCRGDYDRDTQLTPADIARFVSDWFADVSTGCP